MDNYFLTCIAVTIAAISLGPIYLDTVCNIARKNLSTGKSRTFNIILLLGLVEVTFVGFPFDFLSTEPIRAFSVTIFLLLISEAIFIWIYFESYAKIIKTERSFD